MSAQRKKASKSANPFKPGAGHPPPHLAGRESEVDKFAKILDQDVIVKNVVLTGLRGVGKTVLMDGRFKPAGIESGWAWVGSDFSESSFLTEQNLCIRLITDLSVYSSSLTVSGPQPTLGFQTSKNKERTLTFDFLLTLFDGQPGLMVDKLKAVLEFVWRAAERRGIRGIVFAYDEAQVVADQKGRDQYPLAILLEAFQSLQKRGVRYLLLLTGLPTLFPRLVESRTYAERMFSVQEIGRLTREDSHEAITVPLKGKGWEFSKAGVVAIIKASDGYPYFIQFICREALDFLMQNPKSQMIPLDPIIRKLDSDFFSGRWEILSDRQRDLLYCIAQLNLEDGEFTIPDIVDASAKTKRQVKPFVRGDVSQILPRLIERGLIYKNRYGKYSFAVPLLSRFINRKYASAQNQGTLFD